MNQDKKFISARDNLKKYFSFRKYLGNSSAYGKLSGGLYNGVKDGELNENDIYLITKMIADIEAHYDQSLKAIKDFKKAIK